MEKYVAYIRVSSMRQGRSGLGLQAQKDIIKYNAGIENIVAWYEEVHSGKNLNYLPELQKAKEKAKAEKLILIIAKTDRLRNTQQALDLVDELTPSGVLFCNVGRNADKFMLTLFFAFAEKERLEISIRTKAALAILKQKGVKLGRPYNLKNISKETRLVAQKKGAKAMFMKSLNDPANLAVSNIAITLRKKGTSYEKITEYLNSNNYKTPKNLLWRISSIYKLIKRYTETQFTFNCDDDSVDEIYNNN